MLTAYKSVRSEGSAEYYAMYIAQVLTRSPYSGHLTYNKSEFIFGTDSVRINLWLQ